MRLDRNIGRPGGRCQVTISPPSLVGHTGHVRHADIVARSRYSREGVAARSRRDGPRPARPLAAVASATGLARPTARRILLTLEQMGYVRAVEPLDQMGHVRAVDREAVDPKAADPKAVDRKAADRKYVDRKYELTPRVL